MQWILRSLLLLIGLLFMGGCYGMQASSGGGQTRAQESRRITPQDILLPAGYHIEPVATGLTFPTAVTFDDQGRLYITEAGYSYGEIFLVPRLLRIEPDGKSTVIATGRKEHAPWTGVVFHQGSFYVAEGGEISGGRISRIDLDGTITPLVSNLPSMGDHHTNGPAIGSDGFIYFGVGTATNSGIVGPDNFRFGWLARHPDFHDIPGRDIKLKGENYESENPLPGHNGQKAITGAYLPFGTPSTPGQIIPGRVPCTGAIMKLPPGGGEPQLVAWGFRNPFGLAFAPDGTLFITENQFDFRGSRPIWGTGDLLWRITPGLWYGWPDFFSGEAMDYDSRFKAPGHNPPRRLLAELPNDPPQAAAKFAVHASACAFDFSRSNVFGNVGEAFVAEFGDMAEGVGKVLAPVGFKVVRVDVNTGVIHDFASNRGQSNGPASKLGGGGLERPVAARFDPTGKTLYIVDFGQMTMEGDRANPRQQTGVLWRITRE